MRKSIRPLIALTAALALTVTAGMSALAQADNNEKHFSVIEAASNEDSLTIPEIAKKCGTSKKDAEKAVNATVDAITEALCKGDKVQLVGFGGFETKHREAHMGRNPRTKEPVEIPATTVPVFKAGKALKDKVAK